MKNKKLFAILTLVCFMMTLMPVAAFAAVNRDFSTVYLVDGDTEISVGDKAEVGFDLRANASTTASGVVYVWFVKSGANVATTTVDSTSAGVTKDAVDGVFKVTADNNNTVEFKFDQAGTFTLYAATAAPTGATATDFNNAPKIATESGYNKVTVTSGNVAYSKYRADVTSTGANTNINESEFVGGKLPDTLNIDANSVDAAKVTVKLYETDKHTALSGKTVSISTNSSNLNVSKTSVKTNSLGKFDFEISGEVEGEYVIYVTCGGFDMQIPVKVGATGAAYIETVKEPKAPIDLNQGLVGYVEFAITDINGNEVIPAEADVTSDGVITTLDGASKAIASNQNDGNKNYVSFVTKPSASKLTNADLSLGYTATKGYYVLVKGARANGFDAEGTYTVKVALDNGKSATATFEVKEFATPVKLLLTYKQEAIELGGTAVVDTLRYVDANGVTKAATDVELAAKGYAIENFYPVEKEVNNGKNKVKHAKGDIEVKTNEKYIGSEIEVTGVSQRYNLIATASIKVTADAAELAFASKTAEVNVNNKIDVQIVDAEGNKVAPTNIAKTEIYYVILDKPADAKVAASTVKDSDLKVKGQFTMALTSNKIGNVAVQAVAKLTTNTGVVKYYTGTQIFAVGNGSVGDVVVMSIGSHEIVVNDKTATIDAAPMIQNDRTFVPFRALAEAFGAEVAYDEATQAVTAKLNGVEVVMTIGSATYTVNGTEKTADVAPFINGSRTMVPVRFAAEAFGIKVIPTYNPDGTTADILFNL